MTASETGKAVDGCLFRVSARIGRDEVGVPRQVCAHEALPLLRRDMVEAQMRRWHFEPPRDDGVVKAGIRRRSPHCAAGQPSEPADPVVLDSPFKPLQTG